MRIVAARFPDRGRASEVRELLRSRLPNEPDLDMAPLGVSGPKSANDTLLAGRVSDEQAPEVASLVREFGGEIVANVDESWTKPRDVVRRPSWAPESKRSGLDA